MEPTAAVVAVSSRRARGVSRTLPMRLPYEPRTRGIRSVHAAPPIGLECKASVPFLKRRAVRGLPIREPRDCATREPLGDRAAPARGADRLARALHRSVQEDARR